jgi:hypothetical protein
VGLLRVDVSAFVHIPDGRRSGSVSAWAVVQVGAPMSKQRHTLAYVVLKIEVELRDDVPWALAIRAREHRTPRTYD